MPNTRVIRHNSKIPLIAEARNKVAKIDLETVNIGGGLLSDNRFAYFLGVLSTTTATNVGIKIPITKISSENLASALNCDLGVQKQSVVGNSPDVTSSNGWPCPGLNGTDPFYRGNWVVTNDDNYIYIYTSNAAEKACLQTGIAYWFGIEVQGISNPDNVNMQLLATSGTGVNFLRASGFTNYNKSLSVRIFDYND